MYCAPTHPAPQRIILGTLLNDTAFFKERNLAKYLHSEFAHTPGWNTENWKSIQKVCQIYLNTHPYKAAWLENNRTLWRQNYIQSFLVIADFDFTFLWKITIKTSNHAYICDQQVKIYKNQRVVLTFMSVEFLTVFQTVIFSNRHFDLKFMT